MKLNWKKFYCFSLALGPLLALTAVVSSFAGKHSLKGLSEIQASLIAESNLIPTAEVDDYEADFGLPNFVLIFVFTCGLVQLSFTSRQAHHPRRLIHLLLDTPPPVSDRLNR